MSRPPSDNQHVQYVGIDERENSPSVYSYVPAPSYDTSAYVYPVTTPLHTDLSVDLSVIQESEAAQSLPQQNGTAAPAKCRGKLCGPTWMVRVALVLFVVALVQPFWFHSSATFLIAPVAPQPEQPDTDAPPMMPTPPAAGGSDDLSPASPTADFAHRYNHPSALVLSDNSTLITVDVHQGLWRACVNGDCQKMGCCKGNRAASMLCGRSKIIASLLIAGCALILVSLLATCCDRRGKFEGSRKVWIAPFFIFVVLVLGIVSLVLANGTRHHVGRAPVHHLARAPLSPVSGPAALNGPRADDADHEHGRRHHHGHHHHEDDNGNTDSDEGSEGSFPPPPPPADDPAESSSGDLTPITAPTTPSEREVTTIARSVQFGSSFYLVIMGLMSLFYGWLGLLSHACHQRCWKNRCPARR